MNYAETKAEIDRLVVVQRGDSAINPQCYTGALLHGHATEHAIVLWHGFTNCPCQFTELGQLFFNRGFNVYIPLIPRHGLRDRMTDALEGLTVAELKMSAASATRIASGLATNVHTSGLSLGGVLAAWMGQVAAIGTAMPVSPFFALPWFSRNVNDVLVNITESAPNLWLWWDPRLKENCKPDHAYPRFSTRSLATVMLFGRSVFTLAAKVPPLAQCCVLVTNSKDPVVNNNVSRDLWSTWEGRAEMVQRFEFTDLDARHDIIEPVTCDYAPKLVYPVLVDLMLRSTGVAMPIP